MIRMLLIFVILFNFFFFGVPAFRALSGKEKWELTKVTVYSIICASLAGLAMFLIQYFF